LWSSSATTSCEEIRVLRVIISALAAVALAVTLGGVGPSGSTMVAGLSLLLGITVARPWALLVPVVVVAAGVVVLPAHQQADDLSEVISLIGVAVGVGLSQALAFLGRHAR